jgi:hypothetical protein
VPENSDAAVFLQDLKKLIKDAIFIHRGDFKITINDPKNNV